MRHIRPPSFYSRVLTAGAHQSPVRCLAWPQQIALRSKGRTAMARMHTPCYCPISRIDDQIQHTRNTMHTARKFDILYQALYRSIPGKALRLRKRLKILRPCDRAPMFLIVCQWKSLQMADWTSVSCFRTSRFRNDHVAESITYNSIVSLFSKRACLEVDRLFKSFSTVFRNFEQSLPNNNFLQTNFPQIFDRSCRTV